MKRIVLWSGGPDSTKCLIDVLEQTDDEVIAFHLNGDISNEPMDKGVIAGENNAIEQLKPLIEEQYRSFTLKCFSHRRFVFGRRDHQIGYEIYIFPLIFGLEESIKVYVARNEADKEIFEVQQGFDGGFAYSWKLHDLVYEGDIELEQHNVDVPKYQNVIDLGDWYELTWSCMGPVTETGEQCGKCDWCERRKKAEREAQEK